MIQQKQILVIVFFLFVAFTSKSQELFEAIRN